LPIASKYQFHNGDSLFLIPIQKTDVKIIMIFATFTTKFKMETKFQVIKRNKIELENVLAKLKIMIFARAVSG